jgi:hypothetical protein
MRPPGVHHVVRCVEDRAIPQRPGVAGLVGEDVVGAAAHDTGLEAGDGVVVDHRTQRARGEHVAIHIIDAVGADGLYPIEIIDGSPHVVGVDVGHHHPGAVVHEVLDQVVAHMAHALDGDGACRRATRCRWSTCGRP